MKPKELVSYIIDYLNSNINRFVSIDELALYFGYEKSYIMKVFKKHIGITIKDYQNDRRILNSIKGIYNNDLLLKVALDNGYKSNKSDNAIIEVYLNRVRDLNIKLLTYRVYGNKVLRLEIKKEK